MPGTEPEVSDVYRIRFQQIGFLDAHPEARRSAVVRCTPWAVHVVGRESKKDEWVPEGDCLSSDINPSHDFDKEGWWLPRNYKSVTRFKFRDTTNCRWTARLTEPEASELKRRVVEWGKSGLILA